MLHLPLQIIEPSKEVALQLLESGGQNLRVRKLGLDMLRQLSLHHEYISSLVQDGYYLEALRYAQKHKVQHFLNISNYMRWPFCLIWFGLVQLERKFFRFGLGLKYQFHIINMYNLIYFWYNLNLICMEV